MMRFHDRHGTHVKLSPSKTSATRFKSFANAVVFSHRPLAFGETFLFEIEEQEKDWSGHVRCGITTQNPQTIKSVPPYLLPDMPQMGRTWVFAIKSTMQKPLGDEHFKDYGSHNYQRQAAGDKDKNPMFCGKKAQEGELKPTDVGSRIGVKVSPTGELYFFVNGMKFGPCALDVPVDKDLYVALDVYGTTKRVQIIQCGGPLPYKIEAKEEKGEVVSKMQSVEETNIKHEESVANEKPIKRSLVNEAPTKTTKSEQKVFHVFGALLVFTFVIIFFSLVREVGDK